MPAVLGVADLFQSLGVSSVQGVKVRPLFDLIKDQLEVVEEDGILRDEVTVARQLPRRGEYRVQPYSEGVLQHVGNYPGQQGTTCLQTWVGVDLDQRRLELRRDHEIQSKNLEVVLVFVPVQEQACRGHSFRGSLLNMTEGTFILGRISA